MTMSANAGTTVVPLLYVTNVAQTPINQTSVSTIQRRILNKPVSGASYTVQDWTGLTPVSSFVFNSLQTDNGWTGTGGYNFKDSFVVNAVGENKIEYWFTDTSGNPSISTFNVNVLPV